MCYCLIVSRFPVNSIHACVQLWDSHMYASCCLMSVSIIERGSGAISFLCGSGLVSHCPRSGFLFIVGVEFFLD